ncbi:MAG: crossover junction endodeoxyribonuclease RuvC [Alphaproteobacteria bacterium]|nr:crossover junction endodeoxyribonuclease RuvC [Alphaproteobacteria bacterium]
MDNTVRILGLDPGLRHTGWAIIDSVNSKRVFVAAGVADSTDTLSLPERLREIHSQIRTVIEMYKPNEASIEETFVNKNPSSTLKLGQARGAVILAPALYNIPVSEYTPNEIKKAVVGVGHAEKNQVDLMVHAILKLNDMKLRPDAADACAIAICHSHLRLVNAKMNMLQMLAKKK